MKTPFVGDLTPNEIVTAHFLVVSKEIRQKKTGDPYLSLQLADKSGEIESKMWDNVAEVMDTFERDDFVKVKGITQVYQNRAQFTIHKLRRMEDHEVEFADFFPCSARDPEDMFAELQQVIAGVGNTHLRRLLEAVFGDADTARLFRLAPAAKSIHHAWRGGLLEHTLSLCKLARAVAPNYPEVDLDLVLTGAMLHDIGKIEELTFNRSVGYSSDGQLLGHIVLGLRLLGKKFDAMPDFPPKLRSLVEHMVVSHHGELEFGSPKVPVFAEALLFHHLDNLDSKMNAVECALRRDQLVDGVFTGWIGALERVLMKKSRYLDESGERGRRRLPATETLVEDARPESVAQSAAALETTPVKVTTPAASAVTPSAIASVATPEPVNAAASRPSTSTAAESGKTEAAPETFALTPPRTKATEKAGPMNTLFAEKLQAVLGPNK